MPSSADPIKYRLRVGDIRVFYDGTETQAQILGRQHERAGASLARLHVVRDGAFP